MGFYFMNLTLMKRKANLNFKGKWVYI